MMTRSREPARTEPVTVWLLYGYTRSGAKVLARVYTSEDKATEAAERSHEWICWTVEARATDLATGARAAPACSLASCAGSSRAAGSS